MLFRISPTTEAIRGAPPPLTSFSGGELRSREAAKPRSREDAKNCNCAYHGGRSGRRGTPGWRDLDTALLCRSQDADSAPRSLTTPFEPRTARLPLRPLRPLRSIAVARPSQATGQNGRGGASGSLCDLRALCGQSLFQHSHPRHGSPAIDIATAPSRPPRSRRTMPRPAPPAPQRPEPPTRSASRPPSAAAASSAVDSSAVAPACARGAAPRAS